MTKKLQTPSDKFRFITERTIKREKYEFTYWQSAQLRAKTPKGVVWQQLEKGGLISWNWTILHSILTHGMESLITVSLCEEYIATLPQAV